MKLRFSKTLASGEEEILDILIFREKTMARILHALYPFEEDRDSKGYIALKEFLYVNKPSLDYVEKEGR